MNNSKNNNSANREAYIIEARKKRSEWAANDAKRDAGLADPENVEKICDIYYGDNLTKKDAEQEVINCKEHLADIYYPKCNNAEPKASVTACASSEDEKLPVIVSVHGGGWFYGDKELYSHYTLYLASLGFAVVNFNYRLSPEHPYPAGFYDICYMMDFCARNADKYKLDMDRMFMVGDSAGAQLCSQYSIFATNSSYRDLFKDLDYLQVPVPKKIALNCGVYDMRDMAKREELFNWYMAEKISEDEKESFYQVINYVSSDFPKTYLMLSVNDDLRFYTKAMKEKLEEQGVELEYREFGQDNKEDGHVFHLNMRSENGKTCNAEEVAFFRRD